MYIVPFKFKGIKSQLLISWQKAKLAQIHES